MRRHENKSFTDRQGVRGIHKSGRVRIAYETVKELVKNVIKSLIHHEDHEGHEEKINLIKNLKLRVLRVLRG